MDKIRSKYTHPDFQFASFRLSGLAFGIDIKNVREIIRYRTPEGRIPVIPFIEGFIAIRGIKVPVIDLRKRFSLKPSFTGATRIIIASIRSHVAGLTVDGRIDVSKGYKEAKMAPCKGSSAKPWSNCVEVCVETGKDGVNIIDLELLLTGEEVSVLKAPKESLFLKA